MMGIKFDNGVIIGVDRFPDRKHKCLYKMVGNRMERLAYFQTDAKADEFEKYFYMLADLILGK
jgi:hypothetical protein